MKNKKPIASLCAIIVGITGAVFGIFLACVIFVGAIVTRGCTKKPAPTESIETSVIDSNIGSNIESTEQISASIVVSNKSITGTWQADLTDTEHYGFIFAADNTGIAESWNDVLDGFSYDEISYYLYEDTIEIEFMRTGEVQSIPYKIENGQLILTVQVTDDTTDTWIFNKISSLPDYSA